MEPENTLEATVNRLAEIGAQEAKLMRKLARLQKERCDLLCGGYRANAQTLGLDPIEPTVIQPKDVEP